MPGKLREGSLNIDGGNDGDRAAENPSATWHESHQGSGGGGGEALSMSGSAQGPDAVPGLAAVLFA